MTALDPDISRLLAYFTSAGPPSTLGADRARIDMRQRVAAQEAAVGKTQVGSVSDLVVTPTRQRARLYQPLEHSGRELILFFHSGGFTIGDLDTGDPVARALCVDSGLTVLSCEYSLAPERPFPQGISDAVSSVLWADEHFIESGLNSGLVMAGDSAGATIAAVVTGETLTKLSRPTLAQVLAYGIYDCITVWPSEVEKVDDPFVNRHELNWFMGQYVLPGADLSDPRISPALFCDLSGLPPTIVATAELDPLTDQGRAYVERIRAAGGVATYLHFGTLPHGFLEFRESSIAASRAIREICGNLRRELDTRAAPSEAG